MSDCANPDVEPTCTPGPAGGGGPAEVRALVGGRLGRSHQDKGAAWRAAASGRAAAGAAAMLAQLAELGFAWRDIARVVGVSVHTVRRWRRGETPTDDRGQELARFLGACDLIARLRGAADVASWFETPLCSSAPMTPLDLYALGRADLLFALAAGGGEPEGILTALDPAWRARHRSDFEVFDAGDGNRSIRIAA